MHQDHHRLFTLLAGLLIILAGSLIFLLVPRLAQSTNAGSAGYNIGFGDDTVQAKVLDILEEGTVTLGEQTQAYQILLVKLQEGPHTGQLLEIDYGLRQVRPPGLNLHPGDLVLVTVNQLPDGSLAGYFTDFVRARPLLWLLGTFVTFAILISGWKGVRSLLGMAFSLLVIIYYIIPQILSGSDPLLVSITGALVLMAVTLYLTYGWTLKTHAAVLGTFISLLVTGLLSVFFVNLTRLTGFGSEDALFLVQQSDVQINLRGLVLGGMLIGALGVLDDLVITGAQFSTFRRQLPSAASELFRNAMRIGQTRHIRSTLVLAYAGAALPPAALHPFGQPVCLPGQPGFVTEEIVRTLVGSLGLISAVPLTTALASLLAVNHQRLGALRPWLGPLNSGGEHNHHHQ
jgi:uncharacterized membrane protein